MRQWFALAVAAVGVILIVAGVTSDSGEDAATEPESAATTVLGTATSDAVETTSTMPATSSMAITSTTTAPSTTLETTVSSDDEQATPTTVQPIVEAQTVEEFFVEHVEAIESGDVDFLVSRLHPVVLGMPSADLCRAFIEREILALGNYRIAGDVAGPVSQEVAGSAVPELYSVPVTFEFQGQSFTGVATFAPVEAQMHWFTECR